MENRPNQPQPQRTRRRKPRSLARRAEVLRRLQRLRMNRARRGAGGMRSPAMLGELANDTIRLIEQRIRYWLNLGDREHVARLQAVRSRLISTYRK